MSIGKLKILGAMLICVSFVAGCPAPIAQTEALFKDVSKRPPDAALQTIEALAADRDFGEWVIYQDRQCERHGCIQ